MELRCFRGIRWIQYSSAENTPFEKIRLTSDLYFNEQITRVAALRSKNPNLDPPHGYAALAAA
jgi:hypothetical protein